MSDALQFDDAIWLSGFAKRRCRDVVNGNSGRSFSIKVAIVSMTVENSSRFESVDWLLQPAGPEKRINLGIFPLKRRADGRIMKNYYSLFGFQFTQRLLQANSVTNRFLDKLFNERFAIWMKAYIMERERFDGADVAHILFRCAEKLDWQHLVQRFGPDWRVLLSHLVLFGYIYPGEQGRIPMAVMDDLTWRLRKEKPVSGNKRLCRGTLLSRKQYLVDVQKWGFHDARLEQRVHMDSQDIAQWTKAIPKEEKAF